MLALILPDEPQMHDRYPWQVYELPTIPEDIRELLQQALDTKPTTLQGLLDKQSIIKRLTALL